MITALLAAAWLIGVAATAWSVPGGPAAAALLAAVPAAVALRHRPAPAACAAAACAGLALLAVARSTAATAPPPPSSVAWLVDAGAVRLRGALRTDAEERERSLRLRIDAREVDSGTGWRPATGGVLARVRLGRPLRAGDLVQIEGRLTAPPDLPHFEYRAYLARQGILAQADYPRLSVTGHERVPAPQRWLRAARRAGSRALDRTLPQPEAALARGIVVGDRVAIPAAVAEDFRRSGTSHLIAISGFNVTLVAGMVVGGLTWLAGRRRAALLSLIVIAVYALFVGLSPSVVRALIMGGVLIGASLLGRPGAPLVSLMLAAALMTAQDPRVLDDVGFQLSFTATAGIMLLALPLQEAGRRWLEGHTGGGRVAGASLAAWSTVAVTLAATAATLPVILHAFGRLSLIAPAANLLLVPVFPLVMLTSSLAAMLAALLPPSGAFAAALAWPPLAFTIAVAHAAAAVPGAAATVGYPGGPLVLALYLAVGAAALLARRRRRPQAETGPRIQALRVPPLLVAALTPPVLIAGLAAGTVLTGRPPDGRLTVAFAEAGGAPIALVIGPGGERVLVDSGASSAALARALDPLLPPRDRRLTVIVLTREGASTTGGLEGAVERYRPRAVAAPAAGTTHKPLAVGDAGLVRLMPGSVLALSRGARLEFASALGDRSRLSVTAVLGARRLAVTPGTPADAGAGRAGGAGPSRPLVSLAALPALSYDLPAQGPVRLSTDGSRIRLQPARGPLLPLPR